MKVFEGVKSGLCGFRVLLTLMYGLNRCMVVIKAGDVISAMLMTEKTEKSLQ